MNDTTDGYLFWRLSEGADLEPFNSRMPRVESILTEARARKVLAYIRTLGED